MTLPACQKCNHGFSFDEDVVRSFLTLVSTHPDLVAEGEPGGRVDRALKRNRKLRAVLERSLLYYEPLRELLRRTRLTSPV